MLPSEEVEIAWDDEPAPRAPAKSRPEAPADDAPPTSAPRKKTPAAAAPAGAKPSAGKPASAARAEAPRPRPATPRPAPPAERELEAVVAVPRTSFRKRLRRNIPVLAVLGALLVAGAAYSFRSARRYREALPQVAEQNLREGLAALIEGRFDLAKSALDTAASALETLKDPEAPGARQSADEAAIFADLANASLEEIVETVATRPGGWDAASTHKGRSFWIESRIAALPSGNNGYDLEYRIIANGRKGRIDLTGLKLLASGGPQVGDPIILGARIAEVALDRDGLWAIKLDPESGILLTSPEGWKAAESLGWPGRDTKLEDLQ
jgi:hypothetical protein